MKWDCGLTQWEKSRAREQWHPWFAWHPVRLGCWKDSHDCRWWEWVERKGSITYASQPDWEYEYRAVKA